MFSTIPAKFPAPRGNASRARDSCLECFGSVSGRSRLLAIRFGPNQIYRFMFATPPAMTQQLSEPLRRTTFSFRRLSGREKASLKPWLVTTPTAARGSNVARLSRGLPLPGPKEEWFRVLNGLAPNSQPFPNQRVKLVVE